MDLQQIKQQLEEGMKKSKRLLEAVELIDQEFGKDWRKPGNFSMLPHLRAKVASKPKRGNGAYSQIKEWLKECLKGPAAIPPFSASSIRTLFPKLKPEAISNALQQLRAKGVIEVAEAGKGRKATIYRKA